MRGNHPDRNALGKGKKFLFAGISLLAFVLLLEVGLRLTDAGSPPIVGRLRFGYDTGIPVFDSDGIETEGQPFADYPLFAADPLLFWKPIANTDFTGADGLRLPLPAHRAKPNGVYRIAVIGDSCSFLGQELYPEKLARLLESDIPQRVEVVNASCPGYTTFQGLRRLEDVWKWQPDLLLVYFGWNDHWNSLNGCTDSQLASRPLITGPVRQFRHWHTYWFLSRLIPPAHSSRRVDSARTLRVPPNEYRENLCRIIAEADLHQCRTVLLTAPTAFQQQRLPAWVYPFFHENYEMTSAEIAAIPRTHEQYNQIVRQVAEQQSKMVVDVAARWKPEENAFRFRSDCIHLTDQGHAEIAQAVYDECKRGWKTGQDSLPSGARRAIGIGVPYARRP